ncbi:uncharacterized protein J3D65DRAFT_667319 [Phyllosticta citribraziliensis]|uniref:Uncharacterized protein n=1 Tax=Phyllosticta citribraziliensis TaxID=989973 RepID=A0ABR1LU20_9PEZI
MHPASIVRPPLQDREKSFSHCSPSPPGVAPVSHEPFLSPLFPPKQHDYVKEQTPFYRLELLQQTDSDDCSSIDATEPKGLSRSRVFDSILRLKDARFLDAQAMGQSVVIGAVKIAHALERARRLLSKRDIQERRRARKRAAAAKSKESAAEMTTFELASLSPEALEPSLQTPSPEAAAASPAEEHQQDAEASWAGQSPAKRSTLVELFAGKKPPRRDSVLDLGFELADLHECVPSPASQGD